MVLRTSSLESYPEKTQGVPSAFHSASVSRFHFSICKMKLWAWWPHRMFSALSLWKSPSICTKHTRLILQYFWVVRGCADEGVGFLHNAEPELCTLLVKFPVKQSCCLVYTAYSSSWLKWCFPTLLRLFLVFYTSIVLATLTYYCLHLIFSFLPVCWVIYIIYQCFCVWKTLPCLYR